MAAYSAKLLVSDALHRSTSGTTTYVDVRTAALTLVLRQVAFTTHLRTLARRALAPLFLPIAPRLFFGFVLPAIAAS